MTMRAQQYFPWSEGNIVIHTSVSFIICPLAVKIPSNKMFSLEFKMRKNCYALQLLLHVLAALAAAQSSSSANNGHTGNFREPHKNGRRRDCELDIDVPTKFDIGTVELLQWQGYPHERHYIVSRDGYIAETHRIPAPGKPVVLLMAGLFLSSRDFLMNCDGRALAHKLFKNGFDVWLGNLRGNIYARNHTHLSPKSRKFWEFSIDQMIIYDASATVDYILAATGQDQLNWVGYSLGNTLLFGLLASQPQYNSKIRLGVSMGTAVYFGSTRSRLVRLLSQYGAIFERFVFSTFNGEVFPPPWRILFQRTSSIACVAEASSKVIGICSSAMGRIEGDDPGQANPAFLPLIFGGLLSPSSVRAVTQWWQFIQSDEFTMFDYGERKNRQIYGVPRPPTYNLSNILAPILIFTGDNDFITPKEGTAKAASQLPNLVGNIRIAWPFWNHVDYVYGKDADVFVYEDILENLSKFSKRVD